MAVMKPVSYAEAGFHFGKTALTSLKDLTAQVVQRETNPFSGIWGSLVEQCCCLLKIAFKICL